VDCKARSNQASSVRQRLRIRHSEQELQAIELFDRHSTFQVFTARRLEALLWLAVILPSIMRCNSNSASSRHLLMPLLPQLPLLLTAPTLRRVDISYEHRLIEFSSGHLLAYVVDVGDRLPFSRGWAEICNEVTCIPLVDYLNATVFNHIIQFLCARGLVVTRVSLLCQRNQACGFMRWTEAGGR
jgi:hypothetical protein